jgi:hypothetical protein
MTLGDYFLATRPTSGSSYVVFNRDLERRQGWPSSPIELEHMHIQGSYQAKVSASSENSSTLDLENNLPVSDVRVTADTTTVRV